MDSINPLDYGPERCVREKENQRLHTKSTLPPYVQYVFYDSLTYEAGSSSEETAKHYGDSYKCPKNLENLDNRDYDFEISSWA